MTQEKQGLALGARKVESHHPCCLLSTVLLEKKAETGLQETILGVQLQVPGVVELHIEGLLGQYGSL